MLDAATKAQLKSYLERATQPIEIVASLDDSKASADVLSLLKDVVEVSPLVNLTESRDDNHRKPSFSINRPSEKSMCIRLPGSVAWLCISDSSVRCC